MERSGRNKWRSMRFLPWGEGLEGRQLLSGSCGRRTSRMRNSKPCLTILSATRRFARTRRSSPMGRQLRLQQPPRLQLHRPPGKPLRSQSQQDTTFTITSAPTFIDPTARIINGYAVIVSSASFIGPYSTLDAHGGVIKIGIGSVILDNASIVANPLHAHTAPAPVVKIGNQVIISYGRRCWGPARSAPMGRRPSRPGSAPGR